MTLSLVPRSRLYLMKAGPAYQIGLSRDGRLAEAYMHAPNWVRVYSVPWAADVLAEIQTRYRKQHQWGNWYALSDDDVRQIEQTCAQSVTA